MRIYSLPRDSGVRRAPQIEHSISAACHSGLTTQTRSFREHHIGCCRYTVYEYHALYKNSPTLKDRVTGLYGTRIVKAVAETGHIASVYNVSTTNLQNRERVVSYAKFRGCASNLSLIYVQLPTCKANDCLFSLRIFAAFVSHTDQRSAWLACIRHKLRTKR